MAVWLVALMAALSCGLRFWQLARFNELVFDEVYFVSFARDYLAGLTPSDAHPPLGKYLIALSIWMYEQLPLPASSVSYRWLNALVGSAIPLIVAGLAHTLGQRFGTQNPARLHTFALLAGTFVAIDGLFVVESRYGLLNIYMVFFGLLGQWLWLLQKKDSDFHLRMVAGVSLGCAVATKWNGLGFVLSLFIWELSRLGNQKLIGEKISPPSSPLWRSKIVNLALSVLFISSITYVAAWVPHIARSQANLWDIHTSLFSFHQQLPATGHSACSRWFSWPLLIKPISYWYETTSDIAYTVNNMGNPALWWLSSAVVLLMLIDKVNDLSRKQQNYLTTYLLISYASNWLPWLLVSRCTFIYLYMPAATFSFVGLAWVMSGWLHARLVWMRWAGWAIAVIIASAFVFWLPLSMGAPLNIDDLQLRWWLKSWI